MSLLIKDINISTDHLMGITVFPEGFAIAEEYEEMGLTIKSTKCDVTSVPTPHGQLIDADVLIKEYEKYQTHLKIMMDTEKISVEQDDYWICQAISMGISLCIGYLKQIHSIIEAEKEKNGQ